MTVVTSSITRARRPISDSPRGSTKKRQEILSQHLVGNHCLAENILYHDDNFLLAIGAHKYLVFLDDEERLGYVKRVAEENIVTRFPIAFLERVTGLPSYTIQATWIEYGSPYEMTYMVDQSCGWRYFVTEAIREFGAHNLLAAVDQQEHEINGRFIYRVR